MILVDISRRTSSLFKLTVVQVLSYTNIQTNEPSPLVLKLHDKWGRTFTKLFLHLYGKFKLTFRKPINDMDGKYTLFQKCFL